MVNNDETTISNETQQFELDKIEHAIKRNADGVRIKLDTMTPNFEVETREYMPRVASVTYVDGVSAFYDTELQQIVFADEIVDKEVYWLEYGDNNEIEGEFDLLPQYQGAHLSRIAMAANVSQNVVTQALLNEQPTLKNTLIEAQIQYLEEYLRIQETNRRATSPTSNRYGEFALKITPLKKQLLEMYGQNNVSKTEADIDEMLDDTANEEVCRVKGYPVLEHDNLVILTLGRTRTHSIEAGVPKTIKEDLLTPAELAPVRLQIKQLNNREGTDYKVIHWNSQGAKETQAQYHSNTEFTGIVLGNNDDEGLDEQSIIERSTKIIASLRVRTFE